MMVMSKVILEIKDSLYSKRRTFKSKIVSTNFLWTKKLCDYFPENVEGYRDISLYDTEEKFCLRIN